MFISLRLLLSTVGGGRVLSGRGTMRRNAKAIHYDDVVEIAIFTSIRLGYVPPNDIFHTHAHVGVYE